MLDPTTVDELMADYTPQVLRGMLYSWELTEIERAHIIAAIYYLEGTDNA